MLQTIIDILKECWVITGQMSPWLLFGFLVAGILSVFVSPEVIERHLGGSGIKPIVKASLFGIPLPICSCGVIPVAASIRQSGASRSSTISFLLSTPQTGVDSIAITYALLGPVFAVFRPIMALVTGLLGGVLVHMFGEKEDTSEAIAPDRTLTNLPLKQKIRHLLEYGLVTLPGSIGPALILGIVISGAMSVLIPAGRLEMYLGGGLLSILIMMVAGIPVYVCATASVPIAAGFLHMGASPGAALAFLIAGPATNAATFTTIWKVLGKRTSIVFLVSIAFSAIVGGLALDWLVEYSNILFPEMADAMHGHEHKESELALNIWAGILLALLLFHYIRGKIGKKESQCCSGCQESASNESSTVLNISGMSCAHCVQTVQRKLLEVDGIDEVDVNLGKGTATITGTGFDPQQLIVIVDGLGFKTEIV